MPTLVLHGEGRELSDASISKAAGTSVLVRELPGAAHELLHDAGGPQVAALVRDWLVETLR